MKIEVDASSCIASGACVLAAPDLFNQDEDGIAFAADPSPSSSLRALALEAARACPAMAITVGVE